MLLHELARAKINLTLSVLGRRADGYHDIESLVTFADVGDRVTLRVEGESQVAVEGPFAAAIVGENLLEIALRLVREADPALRIGAVTLEKNLPVAAGVGGGSGDAAALLRAIRRANADRSASIDWHRLAVRLGADVSVCFAGAPAVVRGIGEKIEPIDEARRPPPLAAVLVNPLQSLPTAEVFRALSLPAGVRRDGDPAATSRDFGDPASLVDYMHARGNDLELPATSLRPIIGEVKKAIGRQPACRIAAMSGSGATCFGIFADDTSANAAAQALQRAQPLWWIVATRLGGVAPEFFDVAPGRELRRPSST